MAPAQFPHTRLRPIRSRLQSAESVRSWFLFTCCVCCLCSRFGVQNSPHVHPPPFYELMFISLVPHSRRYCQLYRRMCPGNSCGVNQVCSAFFRSLRITCRLCSLFALQTLQSSDLNCVNTYPTTVTSAHELITPLPCPFVSRSEYPSSI